jgi:exopolyphosphatase/guanosine-5'-triphosphate,3'-diphosphate pyrophosphatase
MTQRYASIDIGTNTVLLLVADRKGDADFTPVVERAEITRLGRGVDKSRMLSAPAMEDTLRVLSNFADEARQLGAREIAVSATSAARDAANGAEFLAEAQRRTGVEAEAISGDREAQLTFKAVFHEFGRSHPARPLVVIDIGGGSTEFVYGDPNGSERIAFRRSFNEGSVRLTERYIHSDPVNESEWGELMRHLGAAFQLPPPPQGFRLVGVAGTVTTLYAVQHGVDPYDSAQVHGATLRLSELRELLPRLCATPLAERRRIPGLHPKRADVICAGGLILQTAMELLRTDECRVSDRGLRWGLLLDRFGADR